MALTDYDKKNLSTEDQQKIEFATKMYDSAKAKGDKAGMEKAAQSAATIRNNAGYKTDSSGNYTGTLTPASSRGTASGGSTQNGNSPLTGNGTYKIGSDLGKQKAQNLGIGQEYIASDGSVWTKQNDGSITVVHNGVTTQNAYTPTDYSILLRQQMEAGVPYSYVRDTLGARVDKALTTPGLEQYAYDNTYDMALQYILDSSAKDNQNQVTQDQANWLNEYLASNPQPTQPRSDPRIDRQLNKILNRDAFSYDVANDPLYQQYAQMYQREGDRAMRDTLAEVASGAGGMNSYAVTAAQQAANYYNSQLNDKIPELYQLAYDMYLTDIDNQVRDLGLLQQMDETQYSRYRDTMNDWSNDRNFAYGMYQDAINQGNWQTQFDYNAMIDNRDFNYNDYWNNKEWDANQAQLDRENNRTDREDAQNEILTIIESGGTPPAELVEQSGWNQATIDALILSEKEKRQSYTQPTSSAKKGDGKKDEDDNNGYIRNEEEETEFRLRGVMDLGLNVPAPSEEYILKLAELGLVTISDDGLVEWAEGVNKDNYQVLLESQSRLPSLFNPIYT